MKYYKTKNEVKLFLYEAYALNYVLPRVNIALNEEVTGFTMVSVFAVTNLFTFIFI